MTAIPQSILDQGWKPMVHVDGWAKGARFFYLGTKDGVHTIRTGKPPQRTYQTTNRLLYTKRYDPKA